METQQFFNFDPKDFHKSKIECLRYRDLSNEHNDQANPQVSTILTASEDKFVKIWDRRSGKKEAQLQYGNMPFYSVDTNGQVIAGGTDADLVFWDIRKIKVPLEVLDMSHNDDVTSVRFHPNPSYHQRVLTCSTDQMVNYFDFAGKPSMKEDDGVLEAVYRSDQALLDCGFICNQ